MDKEYPTVAPKRQESCFLRSAIATALFGAFLAIGGFAWYHYQLKTLHTRYDRLPSGLQALDLSFFPRILTIIGLFTVVVFVLVALEAS